MASRAKRSLEHVPDIHHESVAIAAFSAHFGGISPQERAPKSPAGGRGLVVDTAHVALLLDKQGPPSEGVAPWKPAYNVVLSGDLIHNAFRLLGELHPNGDVVLTVYDADFPVMLHKDDCRYAVFLAPRISGSPEGVIPVKPEGQAQRLVEQDSEIQRLQSLVSKLSARSARTAELTQVAEACGRHPTAENIARLLDAAARLAAPPTPEERPQTVGGEA